MANPLPTMIGPPNQDEVAHTDPYEYGWRYIRRDLPDGDYELDRMPLTLHDVLHPQEEDFIVHNDDHQRLCVYLYNVIRAFLLNNPAAVVLFDVRIAWDAPDLEPHGPDIMVIFDVRERRNWSTFDVVEEGVRPSIIIEVTSPKTRRNDLYDKLLEYDQASVPFYIIVDTHERNGVTTQRVLGYRNSPNGYVNLAPNEQGWLWMEPVGLWIGVHDHQVACYTKAGHRINDYDHMTRALTEAEARLRELEAELRRLRGEGETKKESD